MTERSFFYIYGIACKAAMPYGKAMALQSAQ